MAVLIVEIQIQVTIKMRSFALILLLSALFGSTAFARSERQFVDEAEPPAPSALDDKKWGWKEGATSLPPWPKDGDLVEVMVDDPAPRFRAYIDGRNLRIGSDEAIRYTLVLESRTGARNVSFEGLRCTPSGIYKIYAYGTNGRFEKVDNEWQSLHGQGHDKLRADLHHHILCVPRKLEPRPKKDMIRAMRSRTTLKGNSGFMTE